MTAIKTGLPALLLSTALATQAAAQSPVLNFTDAPRFGLAYNDGPEPGTSEIEQRLRLNLRNSATSDNGLEFGTRIRLEETAQTDDLTFGDPFAGRNPRRPDGFAAGGCAQFGADGQLGNHVPIRFRGFAASVGYTGFLDDNARGALATEDGGGNLVNPAVEFDYRLGGTQFGVSADYCLDTGRLFPAKLSASFDYSRLSGNDSVSNVALPYGLGVTGVGYAPGVFVNSPTDIKYGNFSLDRTGFGGGLDFVYPFSTRTNLDDIPDPSGSDALFGKDIARINSFVLGLDVGLADQDETTEFTTDTPAFGINSGAEIRYDTSFDIKNYNFKVGLQHERHAQNGNGVITSTVLRGTVGYSFVDVDASDRVWASGIGGGLNINNGNRISESDGMETASLEAGISRSKGNVSGGISVGVSYGNIPVIDYSRPDSTGGGTPLDPVIGIGGDWSASIRGGFRLRF